MALKDIIPTLAALSLEDLRELNRLVCNQINDRHRVRQQAAAAKFKTGDLIEWTSERHRRVVRGTILSINGKSLTVKEDNPLGSRWRVSPTMCRLVGADREETAVEPMALHSTTPPAPIPEPAPGFAGSW